MDGICKACKGSMGMEKGGMVDDQDAVSRVMRKHYSMGGKVANDVEPIVDGEENQFDVLAKDDGLEFSYTGDNSGDHLGDEHQKEDDRDVVSRVMRSRRMKDKIPRPA